MKPVRKITRREFIQLSTLAGVSLAAACTPAATLAPTQAPAATSVPAATQPSAPTQPPAATSTAAATQPPAPTAAPTVKFNEAPMLAELVKAGKLPPVEQRLPENPMVMVGVESQLGKYGGAIRRAYKGASDRWGPTKIIDRSVVWFDKNLDLVPRLCKSWKLKRSRHRFTINLRKNAKWSDGAPFSSADIQWWFDHCLNNKTLNTSGWQSLGSLGQPTNIVVKFCAANRSIYS